MPTTRSVASSLAPPGRPAHGFGYTADDGLRSYDPPAVPGSGLTSTTYDHDGDGDVLGATFPDSSSLSLTWETDGTGRKTGRLGAETTAYGTTSFGYDSAGRLDAVTTADEALRYGYDGPLATSESWTGAVSGSVGYDYDASFRVGSVSVNGSPVSRQYDADGLLVGAGALGIGREAATGRISGSTLGAVTTSQTYDAYGALATFSASVAGVERYGYELTSDALGRIATKTETIGGVTRRIDYGYDDAGRLATVHTDGVLTASYEYDANGNRLSGTDASGTATGSYDDQDRLLTYGGERYTWGANGELESRTRGGGTSWYGYDRLGNLRQVSLPDGRAIEYVVDGRNRRAGKKVNGALVEGFLYEGQLRPVAWLDASGAVKATFVYGTRVNVPEYMVSQSGTFRILTDHLGSPRLVVDTGTGALVERIDYDEWGQVLSDSNPGFQPFGFAGGLYDRDTGLVRFGARDYDSRTGRWTSKDPIRFRGGLNLYAYCANDPINRKDPKGLLAGGDDAVAAWLANAAIESGMLGGAGGLGAGTALSWAGGAGLAFGGGWLAGTWINGYLEPYIQNGLDAVFGPPGGYQAVKPDLKQVNDIARLYHLEDDDRQEFGRFLEDEKACGRGGSKNDRGDFTWKELDKKIREFLGIE